MSERPREQTLAIELAQEKVSRALIDRGMTSSAADAIVAGGTFSIVGDSVLGHFANERCVITPEGLADFATRLMPTATPPAAQHAAQRSAATQQDALRHADLRAAL